MRYVERITHHGAEIARLVRAGGGSWVVMMPEEIANASTRERAAAIAGHLGVAFGLLTEGDLRELAVETLSEE